jgi:hypothetical protein
MSRTVDDARHGDFAEPIGGPGTIDLYWIPLGAGARVVRLSGSCYELLMAAVQRRPRRDLFHSALIVTVPEGRYSIEMTPIPDRLGHQRGVVAEGCVGSGWLGRWRLFRYEIRCWPDGLIPDLDAAIGEPERLSSDDRVAHSLLEVLPSIPTPVWGRDAMGAGEMWNSNSVTSWALTRSGIDLADLPEEQLPAQKRSTRNRNVDSRRMGGDPCEHGAWLRSLADSSSPLRRCSTRTFG